MKHILMSVVVFGVTGASTWAHTLENEFLRLEVRDDGKVTIHDKRIGVDWLQAIPDSNGPSETENTPVVTSVEPSPGEITVHLKWQIPLLCRWSLSGPDNVRASLERRAACSRCNSCPGASRRGRHRTERSVEGGLSTAVLRFGSRGFRCRL